MKKKKIKILSLIVGVFAICGLIGLTLLNDNKSLESKADSDLLIDTVNQEFSFDYYANRPVQGVRTDDNVVTTVDMSISSNLYRGVNALGETTYRYSYTVIASFDNPRQDVGSRPYAVYDFDFLQSVSTSTINHSSFSETLYLYISRITFVDSANQYGDGIYCRDYPSDSTVYCVIYFGVSDISNATVDGGFSYGDGGFYASSPVDTLSVKSPITWPESYGPDNDGYYQSSLYGYTLTFNDYYSNIQYQDYRNPLLLTSFTYSNRSSDYNSGFELGYTNGYGDGYNSGYSSGYNEGYNAGVDSQQQAIDNAYNTGYNNGYSVGYSEGSSSDETVNSIFSGILQVGLLPINFFLSIFNFEIFGINISSFISALLTVAVTIVVVRVVLGSKND